MSEGKTRAGKRSGPASLLAFRPWMLAAAVILACALGIAILEDLRSARPMWAQATPAQARP
ncbi:MAG TPA: hypothetical protein VLS93_11185 [Anaeromyxobacteraceae bacterium]|nr:hypothetical protein [Anaeromyxobacteraceae bacterium]